MADELGSGTIASLLANEIQIIVDRKTKSLSDIVERQKTEIAEFIELLNEKETECTHKIELAQAQSVQAISDATDRIKAATDKIEAAESARVIAEQELGKVIDTTSEIENTKKEAQSRIEAAEQKAATLIDSAKSEANALVSAANTQIDKAESETKILRQQVKDFTVEQAKHEIAQAQFEQTKSAMSQLQTDIADRKTLIVQLQTEQNAFIKDTKRLEAELVTAKETESKLSTAQAQLVELQKQLSQAQHDLSQSEREISSLSQALASKK
ncbi:hypothetical protein L3081_24455 [Colwellia sp. MSW7]|uniref:Kinetoplast-associated protein n=1 Tax=Colwellia maritima TaxID=2912588 RepID=A0ABS9X6X5_9GAMM|nr:hypothetical protein [Colwellia maritima]MCI2285982.1 hypothetical protein [Colwellia maritima]